MATSNVRPAVLAGTWYSADPGQLRQEVEGFLAEASLPPLEKEPLALIAPHAGHRFSGPVAGYAFRAIQGNTYDTVAVLSPYHQGHAASLLTSAHSSYRTPLGDVILDQAALDKLNQQLAEACGETATPLVRDREHAIEIELPFLQVALAGEFKLLPIMFASIDAELAGEAGKVLGAVLKGKRALMVASTDLSHFYPEEIANRLDHTMLDAIASFDAAAVLAVHNSRQGQACGLMAILTVMSAAKHLGASQIQIVHYSTSGATSSDYNRVVGYGAGVFT
ncbi:MAG: AmmeMemoRadiSam system protein B [Anaerolineales bacterium]|jgi:hypothetical protein